LQFSPFWVLFSQIRIFQFHFRKWTLRSAPSVLVPSYNVLAPIILATRCKHRRQRGPDVAAGRRHHPWRRGRRQDPWCLPRCMDLGADLSGYKYLALVVSSLYSYLFFQTTNINLNQRLGSIVPLYQGISLPFSLFCYVQLIGLGFGNHF
jgi:hypothetical protein